MNKPIRSQTSSNTSWQEVSKWYDNTVGEDGHYYHKNIILPRLLKLMNLENIQNPTLLDIGCGQGVLARSLPSHATYVGVDAASALIQAAKRHNTSSLHTYFQFDATKPFNLKRQDFSHALVILALQNMEDPQGVFKNVKAHLQEKGSLIIIMNHPCFRIPRQSSWGIDNDNKLQYRRVNRYLTPLKIPLQANPSQGSSSKTTWSFHFPISYYTTLLKEEGFVISSIEEWASDKISVGKNAKMENRCREEFPLFLMLEARL
ncbi:MAG: class I SAM-dependent methyltransferase [Chlamydiales bacterium]|nr:class I SAM-dependent methyltransferase [Chlamydiales bacterium]